MKRIAEKRKNHGGAAAENFLAPEFRNQKKCHPLVARIKSFDMCFHG